MKAKNISFLGSLANIIRMMTFVLFKCFLVNKIVRTLSGAHLISPNLIQPPQLSPLPWARGRCSSNQFPNKSIYHLLIKFGRSLLPLTLNLTKDCQRVSVECME